MTLILALPATDGVALVSDTRKWLRTGPYLDGHPKLVAGRDGLVTGTGSARLLDHVAGLAPHLVFAEVVALISHVSMCGVWEGEMADWTLTAEEEPSCPEAGRHRVGIAVYDGFAFKRTRWEAGSTPLGLSPEYVAHAADQLGPVFSEGLPLDDVRTVAFEVYSGLFPSGLVSQDFDFGTHRPGRRLAIERLRVPSRRKPAGVAFRPTHW